MAGIMRRRSTKSLWRIRSREVIARTLAALPADATEKQKRQAVRDAYPFGQREHHPYKCWLAEVKLAFPKPAKSAPLRVRAFFWHAWRPWWVAVQCDGCDGTRLSACLLCSALRDRVAALVAMPEFQAWRKSLAEDPRAALIFGDWLEDHEWDDLADQARWYLAKE